MGQVERDPFPKRPETCDFGINQCQDPGLDDDTRRMACMAVKHVINRDVFYLDTQLEEVERQMEFHKKHYPNDTEWAGRLQHAHDHYLGEMLSHGSR